MPVPPIPNNRFDAPRRLAGPPQGRFAVPGGKGPWTPTCGQAAAQHTGGLQGVHRLNHAGHRNEAARLGPRSYKVNGYPGLGQGDQAGGGPGRARLMRAKILRSQPIPSTSHIQPSFLPRESRTQVPAAAARTPRRSGSKDARK